MNWDAVILTVKDAVAYLISYVVFIGGFFLLTYIHLYVGFAYIGVSVIFLGGYAAYNNYKKNTKKLL